MSQSGKRFLSGLFNRVKHTASESRATKSRRLQTERRLGMEPLEERQLLAADPTLLNAFAAAQGNENVATVASENAINSIDLSSVTVNDAVFSNAIVATQNSHVVNSDISAKLDRISAGNQGWAAALANLLTYTGWSDNNQVLDPTSTESIEQQTFDYISNAFTNDQTSLYYAFGWFMGGASEYIYQGDNSYAQLYPNNTDGGLFPPTSGEYQPFSEYMKEIAAKDIQSPLYGITSEYLDNNYGVGIEVHYLRLATMGDATIDAESGIPKKSWLTLWGYEFDPTFEPTDPEYYTAIYASNPETGDIERLTIEWNAFLNSYQFSNYNQTRGQIPYIHSFDVLQRMPGYGVLTPDAYEVNNSTDQVYSKPVTSVNNPTANLGKIDVITPSSASGSFVNGNSLTLPNLTLYTEGNETTPADPFDFFKFELTQTASNSDSIVVSWAEGVRNQNLKATIFQCVDGAAYVVDPTVYGYVAGHFDSVASKTIEYSTGEDGKTYSKTIDSLTITLAGLTPGEYFLKVEFADDVVDGVNSDYSITFNAGFDDVYETNNSFDEVNELPVSTPSAPTANLGVLYGTTELSDLVLKQYSNVVDETDWYRFEMTEAGTAANFIKLYYNSTATNINDADLDLYLYKYDPSSPRGYTLIAKSYLEMTNVESISLDGVDAGIYYIKVVGNYSAGNVEYKLEINPGVSSVPDLRAEVLPNANWEAPLVISTEKYVPNGSEVYGSEAIIGVDGSVYMNYSFSVNGASKKYGAANDALYTGVRLGMYINGVAVEADDLEALIAQSSYSTTQKEQLIALFCSPNGVDMKAGDTVSIRNLNLGRIVDTGSFAQKYFSSYAQATNSVVIAINPQNYDFTDEFGKVVDHRETKVMTLAYKDGSFYNGSTVTAVDKGSNVEVYRNNRYLQDVVYGVDSFEFQNGDIILVSILSHDYQVAIDGAYTVKDDVVGVLEYAVDNNFASMFFVVTDLSEDAFAPNASVADVMSNTNPDACNPDLGYANIDNLVAYDTVGGEVLYHRVIDNLVITGETNSNGAYTADWFRFRLKTSAFDSVPNYENAFIEIDLNDTYSGVSEQGNLGDLDLYLYRIVQLDETKSFEEAYESGDYRLELIQSSKGVGANERIDFAGLNMTDGNYFICVSGFNGSANRYSMELGGFTKSGDIIPTDPAEYFTSDSVSILNSVATIKWDVPVNDYVTNVNIQYRRVGATTWADGGTYKPSVSSCKVSGLAANTEYEFKLTVTNHFVEDNPLSATVTKRTESYLNETVYRAVIVGVSNYPGASSDLVAAANDAKAFRNALLQDPQWASENIQYFIDSDATRDAVLEALQNVANESDDNDVFVFYFAGSGTSAVIGGQDVGYLKTCGSVRSEFLSSTDLLAAVEQIAAGSKQFILDAGQIAPTAEDSGISYAPFISTLTGSKVNGGSERVAQTSVLVSGDDANVISAVGTGSRSVFNHALVDAMKAYSEVVTQEQVDAALKADKNAEVEVSDGRVTFQELFAAIANDERLAQYNVGVSLVSNDSADTVMMSGSWNEAEAFNEAWINEGAIIVTTTVDSVDAHDGKISLREAAALIGTVLQKESTVANDSVFTLKAGSVVTIGTTKGQLVEDVKLTCTNGSFRTSENCALQTTSSLVEFNRTGLATSWTAEDWNAGRVNLADDANVKVEDVLFQLVATTTDVLGVKSNVILEEGDVLTTAGENGKQAVVKKVGQSYRIYVDDVLYNRPTGLFLDGVPVMISTTVEIAQDVNLNKIVFEEAILGQTLKLNATAGPIVFANGGVLYGSSNKGTVIIDGDGQSSLIAATGTDLVSIVGVKMTNAKGSAITIESGASLELANVLLTGTQADNAAVITNNGVLYSTNNTIVDNYSTSYLVGGTGESTFLNTIIALNGADVSNLTYDDTNVVTTSDPGFVDAANGEYQLQKTSVAIDIGQNSAVKLHCGSAILYDLDGNERVGTASTVDAGAYEYTVALEDRETPSVVVTTLEDIADPTDNEISLREALAYAGTSYNKETTLQEGDIVTDKDGNSYEVTNGKLIAFNGVSGVQTSQYYAIEGVYLLDDFGQPTTLEEGAVVTLTNGTKATVVGTRVQLASGVPVEAGSKITTADGVIGTLSYGVATNFTVRDQIAVNLTKAVVDSSTPVANFDAGIYVLTYQANGTFTATLNVTTTDENNQSTTTSFEATIALVDGTNFTFLGEEGANLGRGSIVTTRGVELNDGVYTLLTPLTHKEGRFDVVDYEAGARLTLKRGVFTDADGVVVDVPKGTAFTAPDGMKVTYQYSNFSVANLAEGTELIGEDGSVKLYKEGLTLYEEVTLGTEITFRRGLESGTITLEKGALSIERAVTLDATRNGGLTIDAHNASRVFTVDTFREVDPNAQVVLNGLTLVGGSAEEGGFIYVAEGSNLSLTGSAIQGDGTQTSTYGGAIYNAGRLNLESNTKPMDIVGVSATYGGAVYNLGTATINGVTITDATGVYGGAIYNEGTATITSATISDSKAKQGGAIYNNGTLSVSKSTEIKGNTAENGAGLYNLGVATIVNSTISDNNATTSGAGAYNVGKLTLSNVKVQDNYAQIGGGAVYNTGQFLATRSLFAANKAGSNAAAIYNTGSASVVSSLVLANGDAAFTGRYTLYTKTGDFELVGSTVVGNSYRGVYVASGTAKIYNSIIGDNVGGDLRIVGAADVQYSMVESTTTALPSTNPAYAPNFSYFDASADWTGWNLRLGSSSAAISTGSLDYNYYTSFAGKKTSVTVDFAGNSRVTDEGVDIGAYASSSVVENYSTVVTTWDDVVDPTDGLISLREAIRYASYGKTVAERTVTFSNDLFALSDVGVVALDPNLKSIVVDCAVTVTTEYVDALGRKQYRDVTVDGTATDSTLFIIQEGADVEFDGMKFTGGHATGVNQNGGAFIIRGGEVTLLDSTIYGNTADRNGGAIYQEGGVLFVIDSLISGNSAHMTRGFGGAICMSGGQAYIYNATITANNAGVYGGVFEIDGLVVLANSIVAKNGGAQNVDLYATNLEATNNLIGAMDPWSSRNGVSGNIVGVVTNPVDPMFTDFAAGDYTLASGSLAINAGVNEYAFGPDGVRLKYDLNANERIVGDVVDMGAFESRYQDVPSTVVTTLADVSDQTDGLISLREAIKFAEQLGTPITFDLGHTLGSAEIRLDSLLGPIVVNQDLTIDASNIEGGLTIVGGDDRIFTLNSGKLKLQSVALTGGTATRGGAIYQTGGVLDLTNVLIYGNEADVEGGAIYSVGGSIVALNSTIAGNSSPQVPGVFATGSVSLQNTIIADNAKSSAVAEENYDLFVLGRLESISSIVGATTDSVANSFNAYDGNFFGTTLNMVDPGFVGAGSYELAQTSIAVNAGSNRLVGYPGYFASILRTAANPLAINTDFAGNARLVGGTVDIGAFEYQTTTETPSVTVTTLDDVVDPFDGLISLREALEYAGSSFYVDGVTTKVGRVIDFAPELAGGVIQLASTLEITKCVTIDATNLPSAITLTAAYADADMNVLTLNGVADSVMDTITIAGLKFTGGKAEYGAGVYHVGGKAALLNCVVYENEADYGAGVASVADAIFGEPDANVLTLVNCTIANNNATNVYGGLWNRGSSIVVHNSIIAGNTVNGEASIDANLGTVKSLRSTLIGAASSSFARAYNEVSGNFVGTANAPMDPVFTDVAHNDFSLVRDANGVVSIAVNGGDSALLSLPDGTTPIYDVDGNLRVNGSRIDMGAYESHLGPTEIPSLLVTTLDDVVDPYDGLISLREALSYANTHGLASTITFAERLSGGTVYLNSSLAISNDVTIDGLANGTVGITLTTSDEALDQSVIYMNSGKAVFNGLTITNRYTDRQRGGQELTVEQGGAVYVRGGTFSLYNSLITDTAAKKGTAIYINELSDTATVNLVNVTIAGNVGLTSNVEEGAPVYSERGVLNLRNTIVAKNTLSNGTQPQDVYKGGPLTSGVTAFNSLVGLSESLAQRVTGNGCYIGSTGFDLSTNVEALFVDAENGDYSLTDRSLATNTGDNSFFNEGSFNGTFDSLDILGNRRVYYSRVDMGAFENQTAKDVSVGSVVGERVNITVSTYRDVVDATDGQVSIREALMTAKAFYSVGYTDINIIFADEYKIAVNAELGSLQIDVPVKINGNGTTIDAKLSGSGLIIDVDGDVVVSNLIVKNGVSTMGAGITVDSGNVTLSSCLVYACDALTNGGGVYVSSGSVLNVYNSTIGKNVARSGSGVYGDVGSTVNLYNTIVASNRVAEVGANNYDVDFKGSFSIVNSLIGDVGTATNAAFVLARSVNSMVGYGVDNSIDPCFVNASGENFKISLATSPARGAGSADYVYPNATDLNGTPIGALGFPVSIGAYQLGLETPSTVVTTLEDVVDPTDGYISLREAIMYAGDCVFGAGCGSVDNSSYNATNAMNDPNVYRADYYAPITFDPSLAGGTIVLEETLEFNKHTLGLFDTLIDASSISGLGGITIDCTRIIEGPAFSLRGFGDPENSIYRPVHLDLRNVRVVGRGNFGFDVNQYSILTLHNTLVTGFFTAVSVRDNDQDQGGLAHIYSSTIVGNISVGGEAFLYNSIVTGGVGVIATQNNPGYRQVHAYSCYVHQYSGRFYGDERTMSYGSVNDLFINPAGGDYRLADRSVACNMGDNTYLMTLVPSHADAEVDLNGNPRVANGTVDIGCYERADVRDVPSTVVNTVDDIIDPTDGVISIREALMYAEQDCNRLGRTVTFAPELAGATFHLDAPLEISRDAYFNGTNLDITIDCGHNCNAFDINVRSVATNVPDVYLRNLTITGGFAANGGAINVTSGNLYLENMQIWGNEARNYGGAIYAYNSELTIVDSRIGGNTAVFYGGIVNEFGKTVLKNSYVAENIGTNVNATADIWGRAAMNYVNSKNNVVGSVADNVTLRDGVDNNRVGTLEAPLKPFVGAATGNLEVRPEYLITTDALLDSVFEEFFEDELDDELFTEF